MREAYMRDPVFQKRAYTSAFHLSSTDLWTKGDAASLQIVVPDDDGIKCRIMQDRHDSECAGHHGPTRTLKLVS